jgi:hypothetical protein
MFVSDSNLAAQLAALGNIPGDHQGDRLIRLPAAASTRSPAPPSACSPKV